MNHQLKYLSKAGWSPELIFNDDNEWHVVLLAPDNIERSVCELPVVYCDSFPNPEDAVENAYNFVRSILEPPPEGKIAFREYDQYPYFLAGTVEKYVDSETVRVEEYGLGCFKPFLVLPHEQCKGIFQTIKDLRKYKRAKEYALKLQVNGRLKDVLPPELYRALSKTVNLEPKL